MTEPSGLLIVNKHSGVTSHDIVGKVRRLFGTRRVGHTGTLDPMASGVLVVLIGRAAKAAEYLVADEKKYRALLCLGLTTDTEDTTGTVLSHTDQIPTKEEILSVCDKFMGEIEQIPPMYSALKVDGQKLCDLARKGVTVERKPRPVTVYELSCSSTEQQDQYILDVHCSSGTYIRTLCADIGASLGCGGAMGDLCRTETGGFSLCDAHTVAELEAMTEDERLSCLIPTERLFDSLPAVSLPEFFEKLCRSGCEIYQKKIRTDLPQGARVRLCSADGSFFALGEVRDYPQGSAIKSIKIFDLGE
ncbi:MAG: tRNA pseudouridine(55) synthase TruB [Clostridia bacterium]|nr:tRNA pseudouridine(55) synthase TruB [Clostridia bacterium]